MQNLAATIFKRIENDSEARAGGYIINTCGWVDGQGYELLLNAIDIFTPDYVLVMSHERLFSDLTQEMRSSGKQAVQIVKMVKSGGVRNLWSLDCHTHCLRFR
jgi:polyribonucleotide 5'-hydroxyl-kinase